MKVSKLEVNLTVLLIGEEQGKVLVKVQRVVESTIVVTGLYSTHQFLQLSPSYQSHQSPHGCSHSSQHVNSVQSVNSYYCDLCECVLKMSSIVKEHMERVHSSQLMKPLVAAAGALLAWKCKYPKFE